MREHWEPVVTRTLCRGAATQPSSRGVAAPRLILTGTGFPTLTHWATLSESLSPAGVGRERTGESLSPAGVGRERKGESLSPADVGRERTGESLSPADVGRERTDESLSPAGVGRERTGESPTTTEARAWASEPGCVSSTGDADNPCGARRPQGV